MNTTRVFLAIATMSILIACSKDKFESKPRIEIKSYSSKVITQHGTLTIKLNYFDKEGDLGTANFFAYRERINQNPLGINEDKADTLNYPLPDFPDKDNGEISFQLGYDDFLKESLTENDTIRFKLAVQDRAFHSSDTITTDPIVIVLP